MQKKGTRIASYRIVDGVFSPSSSLHIHGSSVSAVGAALAATGGCAVTGAAFGAGAIGASKAPAPKLPALPVIQDIELVVYRVLEIIQGYSTTDAE